MKLPETIVKQKSNADEVTVHLITSLDNYGARQQEEYLEQTQINTAPAVINFT